MNAKLEKIFNRYRALLAKRLKDYKYGKGAGQGKTLNAKNKIRQRNNSKLRILAFYEKTGKWPSRLGKTKTERTLGTRFENFVSKESATYDSQFRRIAMVSGRKTNNKRKHNVQEFKAQIIEFIKTNGRAPSTYSGQTIEGEARLRAKLDYYTKKANDMTLLGEVYSLDKCHKSAIPMKYRPIINVALKVEKPLVRMANYELKGES